MISLDVMLNELPYLRRKDENEIKIVIENADPQMLVQEGLRYLTGNGVNRDIMKAILYFQASGTRGNAEGFFYIGKMYKGWYCRVDLNLSILFLELAVQQGHKGAYGLLGDIYYYAESVRDYKKAFENLTKAFENQTVPKQPEDIHAITILGVMYFKGHFVAQDYKKAQELFEIGKEAGNSLAINNLGILYELQGNFAAAFEHFKASDALDCMLGAYNLSRAYKEGIGTEKDLQKYKLYRERAASLGHQGSREEFNKEFEEKQKAESLREQQPALIQQSEPKQQQQEQQQHKLRPQYQNGDSSKTALSSMGPPTSMGLPKKRKLSMGEDLSNEGTKDPSSTDPSATEVSTTTSSAKRRRLLQINNSQTQDPSQTDDSGLEQESLGVDSTDNGAGLFLNFVEKAKSPASLIRTATTNGNGKLGGYKTSP